MIFTLPTQFFDYFHIVGNNGNVFSVLFSNNISKASNSTPTELQQPTETFFDNVSNNKH